MAVRQGELGRIGQRRYGSAGSGSVFFEEFLRELQGIRGVEAYQEMADNDSTIGAILFAIEMLMRQCEFHIQPASDDKADKEAAEFVESCMDDMERTWADTLSEILSFLTYGWSYHEIVYKRRGGKTASPVTNSKFDDGLIGWRKLPIRAQDTLYGWEYAPGTDDLTGMTQQPPPDFGQITIPLEKALHFRTRSRKDNPEGRSILRTAYRDWYFKKRLCEIEAYGIERDLAGFPVLYAPPELNIWDPTDEDSVAALNKAEYIVSSIRRDAREGLVLPGKSADGTQSGWELQLLTSGSRRQFDTNAIIDRYNKQIATSVLADFVMLGQQQVGSFALADSKTKIFALAIGTYLDCICEVFNIQAIPRLIDINGEHFKGITGYPTMEHGDIEDTDLMAFSTFLKDMIGIGVLEPDAELEDAVRRAGGLPERKDGGPESRQPRQEGQEGPQEPAEGQGRDRDPAQARSQRAAMEDRESARLARDNREVEKGYPPFTSEPDYDIIEVEKYNHNHQPPGSSIGGQFAPKGGGGSSGGSGSSVVHRVWAKAGGGGYTAGGTSYKPGGTYGDQEFHVPPSEEGQLRVCISPKASGFSGGKFVFGNFTSAILENGNFVTPDQSDTRYTVSFAVENEIAELGGAKKEGVFFRGTNNPNEPEIAASGELRNSVNHATGEAEDGVSVWDKMTYLSHEYTYPVTGEIIGVGADGEPVLDPKTIKVIGEARPTSEVYEEHRQAMERGTKAFCEKYNWTEEQVRQAREGGYRRVDLEDVATE